MRTTFISILTSKKHQGRHTVFAETLLWALFPIITASALIHIPPFTGLAISTYTISVIFLCLALASGRLHELRNFHAWKECVAAALCIDVVYYSLIFIGLTITSAGNASIIGLCEVFTSYVVFNVIRGERAIPRTHVLGAVLIVSGAFIVLSNGYSSFNLGDMLILLSVCIAPFGNMFQRDAAAEVHPTTVILMRSMSAFPIIFLLALVFENQSTHVFQSAAIVALCINGILLAAARLLWLISITALPPAEAAALSSTGPLITLIVAWALTSSAPTTFQLLSIPFVVGGVYFMTRDAHRPRLHRHT